SVRDCSQVPEFSKLPFWLVMSSSRPLAAYLATSVLPSSITSGAELPVSAVSSLVVTSDHCWICTLTVTFGYFALKSVLTPSTTLCGALPFMSHTVSVPVSLPVLLLEGEPPHAAATSAKAVATVHKSFRGFIFNLLPKA